MVCKVYVDESEVGLGRVLLFLRGLLFEIRGLEGIRDLEEVREGGCLEVFEIRVEGGLIVFEVLIIGVGCCKLLRDLRT